MPKLRKHSNLNRNEDEEQQNLTRNSLNFDNKVQQSNSLLDKVPLVGRKMKYNERAYRLKDFDGRIKAKPQQNQQNISLSQASCNEKVKMETYFNKFTDDDQDSSKESQIIATKSKPKKGIRVSNKFFTNCQFDSSEFDEKQFETQQLLVQKKQVKNAEHLLNKVQKKAQNFKNRLQFKNCEQDLKFRQSMKDKLKSLEGCEEVNLVIEVPKVISGMHIGGALFLKNFKPNNDVSLSNQSTQEIQEQQVPKDRKSFYEGLVKKMKLKKAESITESILKQNFKKRKLDQNDFILDFDEKQNSIVVIDRISDKHITKRNLKQAEQDKFLESEKQVKKSEELYSINAKQHQQQGEKTENQMPFIQIEKNSQDKNYQLNELSNKSVVVQPKSKKPRKKRKNKKMSIKDLIQEQAEDSDDGGNLKKQEENQQSQDGEISSLIDDSITLCEEDEQLAHRKFIKDMMEQQEKKFIMLQKKMQEQRVFEDQHLKMRMEAAAKRNGQRQTKQIKNNVEEQKKISQPSEQSISNVKNMQKLKQLQIDLGLKKPTSSQSNPLSQRPTINKTISNIQKLLSLQIVDIKKPIRNGLKNIQRLRPIKQMKKGSK